MSNSYDSTPKLKPSFRSSRLRRSISSNISGAYRSPLLCNDFEAKDKSLSDILDTVSPLAKRACHTSDLTDQLTPLKHHSPAKLLSMPLQCASDLKLQTLGDRNKPLRKQLSFSFKSPLLKIAKVGANEANQITPERYNPTDIESLKDAAKSLKVQEENINKEISDLEQQGCRLNELDWFIQKLHDYNDIKDVAQMVMGRIAVVEETTVKKIHEQFGLNDDD